MHAYVSVYLPVPAIPARTPVLSGRAAARLSLFALLLLSVVASRTSLEDAGHLGDGPQGSPPRQLAATAVIEVDDNNTFEYFRRISALEGETMVYQVRRLSGEGPVSLALRTVDGTARAGNDYGPIDTTFTWAAGEHSTRSAGVPLVENQNLAGTTKSFRLEIAGLEVARAPGDEGAVSNAWAAAAAALASTTAIIQDDDFVHEDETATAGDAENPTVVPGPGCTKLMLWEIPKPQRTDIAGAVIDCEGFAVQVPITKDLPAARYTDPSGSFYALPEKEDEVLVVFAVTFQARKPNGTDSRSIFVEIESDGTLGEFRELPELGNRSGKGSSSSNKRGIVVVTGEEDNTGAAVYPGGASALVAAPGRLVAAIVSPRDSASGLPTQVFEIAAAGRRPQVAARANGGFVAIWEQDPLAAMTTGNGAEAASVLARSFSFEGVAQSQPVTITSDSTASAPAIAASDGGETVVVWQREDEDGKSQVAARLQRKDGEVKALPLPPAVEGRSEPQVTMNSAGDVVVTYLVGDGDRVEAAIYDAAGAPKAIVHVAEGGTGTKLASPDVAVDDHDRMIFAFERVERAGGRKLGVFRRGLRGSIGRGLCEDDETTLCLNDGRFEVTATWADGRGGSGVANAGTITEDTGYFWFFDEDNLEIVLKMLDGCVLNQRFWVFAGGLTDVEVDLTITDTQTGLTADAGNPPSTPFAPIQNTSLFATCDPTAAAATSSAEVDAAIARAWEDFAAIESGLSRGATVSRASAACPAGALCLHDDRIQIRATWETADGEAGEGVPVALTAETGFFWFFDASNVETVIKVLDACVLNDRFWVFASGLTDVGVELAVTDTVTGETRVYDNDVGTPFQPIQDTSALLSCP